MRYTVEQKYQLVRKNAKIGCLKLLGLLYIQYRRFCIIIYLIS
jgi:hypothetical protein